MDCAACGQGETADTPGPTADPGQALLGNYWIPCQSVAPKVAPHQPGRNLRIAAAGLSQNWVRDHAGGLARGV